MKYRTSFVLLWNLCALFLPNDDRISFIKLLYVGHSHGQITCGIKPFTTMIIIIVNHHSFPVSQEPTRSNMEYFWHFPMAWSGTTVCCNWNNMPHINTPSYWTVTTVCSYRENDVSLFSSCCCHNDWHCSLVSLMINLQHHLVDVKGKLTNQQLLAWQGQFPEHWHVWWTEVLP